MSDLLSTQYGIKFGENPESTQRLFKGVSTVDIDKKKAGMYGLSSEEDVRKFEELNGFKLSPKAAPPLDLKVLNEQSTLDNHHTLG